jgi:hypothetical protein
LTQTVLDKEQRHETYDERRRRRYRHGRDAGRRFRSRPGWERLRSHGWCAQRWLPTWAAPGREDVARRLSISAKTVSRHLENGYAKAGIRTRAATALYVVEHGLLADVG